MSAGQEFEVEHGPQGKKRARYLEFKDGKHHYEYWSATDQAWKPEARSDEALRKAMYSVPDTFTSAEQVPVSPEIESSLDELNKLLADAGIPPITVEPTIPGQHALAVQPQEMAPIPSPPGSSALIPFMDVTAVPDGYGKRWSHILMSGGGYASRFGRQGKKLADYVQLLRRVTAAWTQSALHEIEGALVSATKNGGFTKGDQDNLLLVMEKRDLDAQIEAAKAEFDAAPPERKPTAKLKLETWEARRKAIKYNPSAPPAQVKSVADTTSAQMSALYAAFRAVAYDQAAGVIKDYAPHFVAQWVLDEAEKGAEKSVVFRGILDDTAKRIIEAQQQDAAKLKAAGKVAPPVFSPEQALEAAGDFFAAEGGYSVKPLTRMMGNFELKRSDIVDPAFLDYSMTHFETYFNDGAMRVAQYEVWSENDGKKITKTPDAAIDETLKNIVERYGNKGTRARLDAYIQGAHSLYGGHGEDPAWHAVLDGVTGVIVVFRLVNPDTQLRNVAGAFSIISNFGLLRASAGYLAALTPGFVPWIGPWAHEQRTTGIRAGALPGVMTKMIYHEPQKPGTAGLVARGEQALLNVSQGWVERLNRQAAQTAGSMLAQSIADIMRGGDPSVVKRSLRNFFEFGPLKLAGKSAATEAETILRDWFKFTDDHIEAIKSHPTGRLDQIAPETQTATGRAQASFGAGQDYTLDSWARGVSAEETNFLRHPDFAPVLMSGRSAIVKQAWLFMGYSFNIARQTLNMPVAAAARGNLGPAAKFLLGSLVASALWDAWDDEVKGRDKKSDFEIGWRKKLFWMFHDALTLTGVMNFLSSPGDWMTPGQLSGMQAKVIWSHIAVAQHMQDRLALSGKVGVDGTKLSGLPIGYVGEEAGFTAVKLLESQISAFRAARDLGRRMSVTKNTIDRARFAAKALAPELQGLTDAEQEQEKDRNKLEKTGIYVQRQYEFEIQKIIAGIEANDPGDAAKAFRNAVEVRSFGDRKAVDQTARNIRASLMSRSPLGKISSDYDDHTTANNPKLAAFEKRMVAAGKADDAKEFLAAHRWWAEMVGAASLPWVEADVIEPQLRTVEE